MDFRAQASAATSQRLADSSAASLAIFLDSGCLPIPRGRAIHCWIELPAALLSLSAFLSTIAIIVLRFTGVLSPVLITPLLLAVLVVALLVRSVKSLVMKAYLSSRREGFLGAFPELPKRSVGLESGLTYEKVKWVMEDSGICLFDERNRLILIEGCEYRYIIRAKDVLLVEPLSGYGLSGARVLCRMSEHTFNAVLKAAGQGPVASLVQAFAPRVDAASLATDLNKTFFGVQT